MLEAAAVIADDNSVLYWHLPPNRTAVSLPDSNLLWEILKRHRNRIWGVAHTHPGVGWPVASNEDFTTFQGLELGLGKPFSWWILSGDRMVCCTIKREPSAAPADWNYWRLITTPVMKEPLWAASLRTLSRGEPPHANAGEEQSE